MSTQVPCTLSNSAGDDGNFPGPFTGTGCFHKISRSNIYLSLRILSFTLSRLQSRFADKVFIIQAICPQRRTAVLTVLKGLAIGSELQWLRPCLPGIQSVGWSIRSYNAVKTFIGVGTLVIYVDTDVTRV